MSKRMNWIKEAVASERAKGLKGPSLVVAVRAKVRVEIETSAKARGLSAVEASKLVSMLVNPEMVLELAA